MCIFCAFANRFIHCEDVSCSLRTRRQEICEFGKVLCKSDFYFNMNCTGYHEADKNCISIDFTDCKWHWVLVLTNTARPVVQNGLESDLCEDCTNIHLSRSCSSMQNAIYLDDSIL